MSEAKRRKIRQLRALAASTTFPEEAKSANAKADKLEAELGPELTLSYSDIDVRSSSFPTFEQAWSGMSPTVRAGMEDQLRQQQQMDAMIRRMEQSQKEWLREQLAQVARSFGLDPEDLM